MSLIDLAARAPHPSRGTGRPVAAESRPRNAAFTLPDLSLSVVGLALLSVLVVAQAVHGFTDPDFWWHYKTGEYIVTQQAIPRIDFFTYPSLGQPWIAHEWLAEALIYSIMHLAGYAGALFAFALSPLAAMLLLYRLQREEGVAANVALAITALAALMLAPFTTVRPQVLSWVCFAVLIYLLFSYRSGRIHQLWALPVLFAIWANLHLSFAVGLGILALFVASDAAARWISTRTVDIGHPLLVLAASIVAACINPNGPRLLLVPLSYLPLQSAFISPLGLAEWKAPDFHNYLFLPLLAGLVLLMAIGTYSRPRDLWPAGLAISSAGLSLLAVRYIPVFAIAFAPAAGIALASRWSWAQADGTASALPTRRLLHWGLMGLTLACLLVALRPGSTSQLRREPDADPAFLPVESVNFIQMNYPSARIFNQYDWGGYLIYRLWPQNHPFIDGRGEMYPLSFLKDYVRVYAVQPGWEQILSRYDVDLVVIRNNTSLAGALESDPGWRLAHQDRISVIYTRNEKVH